MINEKQIDNMLHALGRPNIRLDWKPETILRKANRNYFYVFNKEAILDELVIKGLMSVVERKEPSYSMHKKSYIYFVTLGGVAYLMERKRKNKLTENGIPR